MNRKNEETPGTSSIVAALIAFFVLLSVWNVAVFAEEGRPCADDIASFCKDVKPGGGRIILCLKQHEGELSSVCKDKLQELQKRIDEFKRVCSTDIEKFCKGVEPGEGRIARCLEGRTTELTPACADETHFIKTKLKGK